MQAHFDPTFHRFFSRAFLAAFAILFCSLVMASQNFAQIQDEIAPPPIKMLSKSERMQLSEKTQLKDRTSLAVQLMETRLRSAEKLSTDENYSLMYAELGGFQALMDNTLAFLLNTKSDEGKQLNSLKKFEIALRAFSPRIEALRRDLPGNFEPYVKNLLILVSTARERAMQPFFSDTVISN